MSYPKLFLRIKGMLMDSLVFGVLLFSMVLASIQVGIENTALKTVFIVLPLLIFEPAFICLTGGSLGHHYAGIRVVDGTTENNLNFFRCVIRFVVKIPLGIISLVSMVLTKRHQAIHDYLSNSVVTFKSGRSVPEHHKLVERKTEFIGQKPSIARRLVVILAFSAMWILGLGLLANFIASAPCLENSACNEAEEARLAWLSLIMIVSIMLTIVVGLFSKLPGAYYRKGSNLK